MNTLETCIHVGAIHELPLQRIPVTFYGIRSKNDDIRNGMALCRLCHWGFDEGMLGVSDSYAVITSRSIGIDPNFPGLLLTLSGRSIIPPQDRDLWPAQEYLHEHRREWRL